MKKLFHFVSIILCVLMLASCAPQTPVADDSGDENRETASENTPTPSPTAAEELLADNDWQFDEPENRGMSSRVLGELAVAIADVEICSVLVAKEGNLVFEYYKDGFDENSVFRFNSCTKSFSSALIGIAIDMGLISGTDAKIYEFFPQISEFGDARKWDITIEDLLTQTSGIKWPESGSGTMFRDFTQSENWVEFVLEQPMAANPGSAFNYSTGNSHLLAAIIQQTTGETASDFADKHLLTPLGVETAEWRADPQGVTDGGNGISMTARDAAKFGQLYLDGGVWKGSQIVPQEWVELSTKAHNSGQNDIYGSYGYQWWVKSFGGYDAYFANGHGGQYIIVVPELELVTVITSRLSQSGHIPQSYFVDYVIGAVI